MRLLSRNKTEMWFANRSGETYVTDSNSLKTGEKTETYGEPQKVKVSMSISSGANNLGSQGMANLDPYGINTAYTHNAVTEDMNCTMDEESIVWYERLPTRTITVQRVVDGETVEVEEEVPVPHNYKVVRKAKSLNHLIYYLKEVDVS